MFKPEYPINHRINPMPFEDGQFDPETLSKETRRLVLFLLLEVPRALLEAAMVSINDWRELEAKADRTDERRGING